MSDEVHVEQSGTVTRGEIYNAVCGNTCGKGKYGVDHVAIADALLGKPKPAEPNGLGAVVEDEEGVRYVRLNNGHWADGVSFPRSWPSIPAVRVLSEGVPA